MAFIFRAKNELKISPRPLLMLDLRNILIYLHGQGYVRPPISFSLSLYFPLVVAADAPTSLEPHLEGNPGLRILDPGTRIPDPAIQNPGSWTLNQRF